MTAETPSHAIHPAAVKRARKIFKQKEPRDLFYRAAADLIDRALCRSCSLSVAEALAVLLQTWNRARYRYKKFDANHFSDIETLLRTHRNRLHSLRKRRIQTLTPDEKATMVSMFEAFEVVLGPVGTAKALHLLAPRLFPLWDRKIAAKYGVPLRKAGLNGERYWRFMLISQRQCRALRSDGSVWSDPLKALDEYNYCRYTKGWLSG